MRSVWRSLRLKAVNLFHRSEQSSTRRLLQATAILALVHVLIRLMALAKDLLLARAFGVDQQFDAYLAAFAVPAFLISILGSTFATAFLPTYIRVRATKGSQVAAQLASFVILAATPVLIVACLTLQVARGFVLSLLVQEFDPATFQLANELYAILTPIIFAAGISAIFVAILNGNNQLALPTMIGVATPLVIVVAMLASATPHIERIAWATAVGFFAETIILGFIAVRLRLLSPPRQAMLLLAPLKHILKQYWPLFLGTSIMGLSPLIDQAMAASIGPGSISALNYGNKLVALIVAIVSLSLTTAVFPYFSQVVAEQRWAHLRQVLKTQVLMTGAISLAVTLGILAFGPQLVRLFYERGNFDVETTRLVANIQAAYAVQIPAYLVGLIGVRLLNVLDCNRAVLCISISNLATKVIGNYLLRDQIGIAGIALSTSVTYCCSTSLIFMVLLRAMKRLQVSDEQQVSPQMINLKTMPQQPEPSMPATMPATEIEAVGLISLKKSA